MSITERRQRRSSSRYWFNTKRGQFEYKEDDSYQWTEEDTWDALTDGQYGDYPEEGVDWDHLYDALGL